MSCWRCGFFTLAQVQADRAIYFKGCSGLTGPCWANATTLVSEGRRKPCVCGLEKEEPDLT